MKWTCMSLALMLAMVPSLVAQHGNGGGNQRQGSGAATRAKQGSMDRTRDQTQDRTKDRLNDRARTQQRDRLHSQVTTQERDQFQSCDRAMSETRTQARTMARDSKGTAFDLENARRQHQQLQEQIRTMAQNHEQLMQGLNEEQRSAVQDRAQTMAQMHERIQNRLQEIHKELSGADISGKRVADQARATEREMNAYQKEFRRMGEDLGMKTD